MDSGKIPPPQAGWAAAVSVVAPDSLARMALAGSERRQGSGFGSLQPSCVAMSAPLASDAVSDGKYCHWQGALCEMAL